MFTMVWWYIFATWAAVLYGLFVGESGFYVAIGLCMIQALYFGIEDKNPFSFSCQVRYALAAIFIAGLFEPLRWIYWIPAVGLTVRLTLNYCLLARLVSLMPWNRRDPFSWGLFRRTLFSPPTSGSILAK